MSEFNSAQYVEKWDRIIGPVMLAFIVSAVIAVIVLNRASIPDCQVNEMIYCGETAGHHGTEH